MLKQFAIGIDLGGTNLRVGVFDNLTLIEQIRVEANCAQIINYNDLLAILEQACKPISMRFAGACIGFGIPGFISPHTQIIAQSPNLPALNNAPLAQDLSARLATKVIVENDALAAAYGEFLLANSPANGLLYIGLGTGVGGGFIHAGLPFAGAHGVAMEVGHIIIEPNGRQCGCGNRGCLEQYASASGVINSYFLSTNQRLNTEEIADLARQGDKNAASAFVLVGNALGQALAHVQKVVDIPNVTIGGGLAKAWDLIAPSFNERLDQDLITVLRGKMHVQVSTADDIAGMLGAAKLASL